MSRLLVLVNLCFGSRGNLSYFAQLKAKEWGKKATALSRQREITTGTAHDERFGKVRTYHEEVLREVIE